MQTWREFVGTAEGIAMLDRIATAQNSVALARPGYGAVVENWDVGLCYAHPNREKMVAHIERCEAQAAEILAQPEKKRRKR